MTVPAHLRFSNGQPDGRAVVKRKWLIDKTQGAAVVLAERVVKAMIRRRWPTGWERADGQLDPLRLLGPPPDVRFFCLSSSYDAQAFMALLHVTVSSVALLEGRAVQAAILLQDDVLSAPGCFVKPDGKVGFPRKPSKRWAAPE